MNAVVKEVVAEPEQPFAARVWQTLSRIDCSKHTEKKQHLTYLSWAWAWAILMEHFPESEFAFDEPREFPDGTYEIWVAVSICEGDKRQTREMWLPVLDYKMQPIKNPTAYQINTTRMRCLTKAVAMFGLGHYIYAGEDLPRPENDAPAVGEKRRTGVVQDVLDAGAKFDAEECADIIGMIDASFTMDPVEGLVLVDEQLLDEKLDYLRGNADLKIAVWGGLPSKVRSFIKARERG